VVADVGFRNCNVGIDTSPAPVRFVQTFELMS